MHSKAQYSSTAELQRKIEAARGKTKADIVIKNAHFLDVFTGQFCAGDVAIQDGTIVGTLDRYEGHEIVDGTGQFLVPGFIDAHVHIESSLMHPARFQECVLPCGTTTAIWDPHEIANVRGVAGIEWALAATETLDMDVFVMLPSCVPSTTPGMNLESSGAQLMASDLLPLRNHPRVLGLAEMMNFPGLLMGEPDVLNKIHDFNRFKRDGHCPGLEGHDLNAYAVCGIHSCHESVTIAEAREKLIKGIQVLIREGSCAKNARTMLPLVNAYSSAVIALCSDDRNPFDIHHEGHIDFIIKLGMASGIPSQEMFRVASFAAARAYGLDDRGAIAAGYKADICMVQPQAGDFSKGFKTTAVWKSGRLVRKEELKNTPIVDLPRNAAGKNVHTHAITTESFAVPAPGKTRVSVRVIEVIPNQIVTKQAVVELSVGPNGVEADLAQDVLKIAVFERHHQRGFGQVAFVRGFHLKDGAIATTINHDSHNIIVVGTSDEQMQAAIDRLIAIDGGIVAWKNGNENSELRLPIAGLMTIDPPLIVDQKIKDLRRQAAAMGCTLDDPFLQLSFLALPVIPELKITDKGLVDVNRFSIVEVCV